MTSRGKKGYKVHWYYILKTWRFESDIIVLYVFVVLNLEANAAILTSWGGGKMCRTNIAW